MFLSGFYITQYFIRFLNSKFLCRCSLLKAKIISLSEVSWETSWKSFPLQSFLAVLCLISDTHGSVLSDMFFCCPLHRPTFIRDGFQVKTTFSTNFCHFNEIQIQPNRKDKQRRHKVTWVFMNFLSSPACVLLFTQKRYRQRQNFVEQVALDCCQKMIMRSHRIIVFLRI